MSQSLMPKKLKLTGSMKTYKTFQNTKKKKRCPFYHRGLECKSRKSGDTWSNRQVWPWSTKWGRAKANRVLPKDGLVIADTLFQPQKRQLHVDIIRWSILDQIDYILCTWRWESSIQSVKRRSGTDCGSDHEFLIAEFRLKLKKVGKTTGPFRYALNQIPFDYVVDVMERFKGADLKNYGWRFMTL